MRIIVSSVCSVHDMHTYAHDMMCTMYIPENLVCRYVTVNLKLPPQNNNSPVSNNGAVSISSTEKWGTEKIKAPGSYWRTYGTQVKLLYTGK